MKRLLLLLSWTTIVAAFPLRLAAAVVIVEDVPVPGGTDGFARALGFDAAPDRARFAAEITRMVYGLPEGRNPLVESWLQQARLARGAESRSSADAAELVPIPLTAAIWSDAVFHRRVPSVALFAAILADRQAALVCHGLTALDDETLTFFAEHPSVVRHLYEHDASVFATFSAGLHIRANRIVPAGALRTGDEVTALWEAVVGEQTARPDRFIQALFARDDGRLAYLYDTIAALDAPHRAFALGLWIPASADRVARFKALGRVNSGAFREWHPKTLPFARPIYDPAMLLERVQVDPSGAPRPPASRATWAHAFDDGSLAREAVGEGGGSPLVDAAWLAEAIGGDMRERGDRLEQLSFGQRVFGSAPADQAAAVASALRDFPRYRMLMLTLERLGIVDPAMYAEAARGAARFSAFDRYHSFVALAQFQGALALVVRMHTVRAIDRAHAEAMVRSLFALPMAGDGYAGAVAGWIAKEFPVGPVGPPRNDGADIEDTIIARLAGVRGDVANELRVTWEGQPYHLDLAAAEERRLRQIREKQGGVSVGTAVALAEIATRVSSASADVADSLAVLKEIAPAVSTRTRSADAAIYPPGVVAPRNLGDIVPRAIDQLTRIARTNEPKRAAHAAEPLLSVADDLLAEALLSLAYAVDLGDPDGTVLLAGNVARRHDFGLGLLNGDLRARAAWSVPRQDVAPGVPWHVAGSALGLDVALASLALRRVDSGRIGDAPRLTSNERQTFATSVALLNPVALNDVDRDAIVDAVARGRRRVAGLAADPASLDAAASDLALDPARRRAIAWALAHDRDRVESMFSLTELLYLGGVPAGSLDAWGMAAQPLSGCFCTKLSPPGAWRHLTGRPQLGLLATTVADLNLRVAIVLHELHLPAAIARHVLGAAMQDFIDEVKPTDPDDWLTMVRAAQSVGRERIEDYVAAVAADGPLVPDRPRPPQR